MLYSEVKCGTNGTINWFEMSDIYFVLYKSAILNNFALYKKNYIFNENINSL